MDISAVEAQIAALREIQLVHFFNLAGAAIFVYDYSITFSREVIHIWQHSFSAITLLFLITRYLPFVDSAILLTHGFLFNPTLHTYSTLFKTQVWCITAGTVIATVVLVLRTCAIYFNRRRVIVFLSLLYATMVAIALYFVQAFLSSLQFGQVTSPLIRGFSITHSNQGIFVVYAALLAFETVVMIMTILRAKSQGNQSHLHHTLYQDSLCFYIYIFVISLCNILLVTLGPGEAKLILTQFHRVSYSIFPGRIILNIRGATSTDDPSEVMHGTDFRLSGRSTLLLGDNSGEMRQVVLDSHSMVPEINGGHRMSGSEWLPGRGSEREREGFELRGVGPDEHHR